MSDEERSTVEEAVEEQPDELPRVQPAGEEHTTVPNPSNEPEAAVKWEMPKPVFQKTSGYLPQGYLKDMPEVPGPTTDADGENGEFVPTPASRPKAESDLSAVGLSAPAAGVEPQPDLEQLIPHEPEFDDAGETEVKSRGVGTSLIVLGLVALMLFVAVFLTVVYFLFFAGPGEINNF